MKNKKSVLSNENIALYVQKLCLNGDIPPDVYRICDCFPTFLTMSIS